MKWLQNSTHTNDLRSTSSKEWLLVTFDEKASNKVVYTFIKPIESSK